ncbi:PrsW family glutamic-type intramembrane protease [Dermacoccus nishinomiyaensis]|uniref:PrsW family glutamic-type intramembrane protease n=1 Tax=Dermacoccus nishinomiyaensis TaxID=1274 RepID=UPI001F0D1BF9|nr:PrsW family glutamic-type intramembrane protease [Dermacoccus nishinomiyaensis]
MTFRAPEGGVTAPSFSRSSAYFEKDEQTLTLAVVDGSVDFDTTADRIVRHLDEQGVAVAFDGGKLSTRNGFAWLAMHANDHLFALSAKPLPEGKGADRGAAIAGPTSEERAKMLGVVIIMLVASRTLRRSMHGLLVGAFVGCRWRGACSRSTGSSHWVGGCTSCGTRRYPRVATARRSP